MFEFLVQIRRVFDAVKLAVDFGALKPVFHQLGELFLILALTPAHDGGEDIKLRILGDGHDAVNHLADGLARYRQTCGRRVRNTDPRPKQAHIVIYLGNRADSRARVFRRRLLLNRNRGREAFNTINIGLALKLKELARIGREALNIAALPLSINRIKGEGRFARA